MTLEEARAQVARMVGEGDHVESGQIPFTPRAKKVLELALREALSLGHIYLGTEHILLGIVRDEKNVGPRVLLQSGEDAEAVRNEVIRSPACDRGTFQPLPAALDKIEDRLAEIEGRLEAIERRLPPEPQ